MLKLDIQAQKVSASIPACGPSAYGWSAGFDTKNKSLGFIEEDNDFNFNFKCPTDRFKT